ncbi:MAG: ABC transporter ATP-binding protein [Ilumatobacteraceae bacterium]
MNTTSPTTPDCLEVTGLHVRYPNGAHAVRGVDLAIGEGDTVALVGESGSGKTTIAHAVLGLLPKKTRIEGTAYLGPDDTTRVNLLQLDHREWRSLRGRRIGYIAQNPFGSCDPLRSVEHHVASAWTVHRERPPDGAVEASLTSLGIADAARRARLRPHQWSGGMLQRASIAGARALGPELVVADEPTSALDADLARSTLLALRDSVAAALLVTHDLSLAEEVADTIYVLYGGEVMEHGRVSDIMASPQHPYTRSLLAAVPQGRGVLPTPLPGNPPDPLLPRTGCAFAARCPEARAVCAAAPSLTGGVACHLRAS